MSNAPPNARLHNQILARLLSDTELNQCFVRLLLSSFAVLFVEVVSSKPYGPTGELTRFSFITLSALFFCAGIVMASVTFIRPGHSQPRRLIAIALDYTGIAALMTIGGPGALPTYAIIVWMTVGYGIRFGSGYLTIAAIASMICLACVIAINPYLRSNQALSATLVITALIVPAYAFVLLKQVRALAAAAHQANLEKSVFLAQASHDLRQPIHAAGLFVEQLKETILSAEQMQMVSKIERSLQGTGQLFQSLLDVSALESGGLTPDCRPVNLGALFKDIERQNEASAQWTKSKVSFIRTSATVITDPVFLATMIQNLIGNALKYAPDSRIVVGCRHKGGQLSIGVYDNGPGITDVDLTQITKQFFRAEKARASNTTGMGLGLSIVERIAVLMKLKFSVKSTQGRGVAALIEGFAVIQADVDQSDPFNRPYPKQMRDLSVLLIEDDQDTLDATDSLLSKWGCRVEAHTAPPIIVPDTDFIISDFEFKGGDTLAQHLPRLAQKNVPIIVITGTDPAFVKAALRDPEAIVLSKPLRPAQLRSYLMAQRAAIKARI